MTLPQNIIDFFQQRCLPDPIEYLCQERLDKNDAPKLVRPPHLNVWQAPVDGKNYVIKAYEYAEDQPLAQIAHKMSYYLPLVGYATPPTALISPAHNCTSYLIYPFQKGTVLAGSKVLQQLGSVLSDLWGNSVVQSALFNHYDLHLGNAVHSHKRTIYIDQDRALSDITNCRNDVFAVPHFNDLTLLEESVATTLQTNLKLPISNDSNAYSFTNYVTINQTDLIEKSQTAMAHFAGNKNGLLRQKPDFEADINIIGLRCKALIEQLQDPNLMININKSAFDKLEENNEADAYFIKHVFGY